VLSVPVVVWLARTSSVRVTGWGCGGAREDADGGDEAGGTDPGEDRGVAAGGGEQCGGAEGCAGFGEG
jgi:hypothetical protein